MIKRFVLAVLAIFVAWSVLDFLIHGLILQSTYEATAQLWRPMDEMKVGLMYLVTVVVAATFTAIYALLVAPKSVSSGVKYGLLFGVATGFPMAFGTYSVMPVHLYLSVVWLLGALVEMTVGGVIIGAIITVKPGATSNTV